MNPKIPPPDAPSGDETALSSPAAHDAGEATDASGPTDATIVRAAPSSPTVDEMASPNNFGRYELLGEVARGGMGVVYKARQHGLERLVALKMILGTGPKDEAAQRFLQEARAAAALDHPNVVPIYDIGENAGRPYFTMALIDGPNLRGYADAHGVLPIPLVVSLFAQVVAGVAHAHAAGIIHRDLKPANVLIDKDGRPRVTDFGLAKRASADSQLTVTGQVVGTPSYMAPEQARDSKDVGPPADVYALGAILYFLLTGRPPFVGDSLTDLLIKVVTDAPLPPRELRPDVPPEIEALCLRCLAKTPGERFADAQALADALAPITDQFVPSSSGLSPSLARIGLSRASTGSVGTIPDLSAPSAGATPVPSNSITASLPRLPAPAPARPEPGASRRPLAIGLCVAGVLLAAAIGYFATQGDKKKDDTAKQEPPPAVVTPTPALVTPAPTPTPVPTPVPTPAGKEGDKLAWPAPMHADFGLKFELAVVGKAPGADGVIPVTAGTHLVLHLTAEKDCRVAVWLVEPNGDVLQVLPNEFEADDRLKAGQKRVVGTGTSILEASVTAGDFDRLFVRAVTGDAPTYPTGVKLNQYSVYTTPADRERIVSAVRGVTIKKAGAGGPAAVAEAELRFRAK